MTITPERLEQLKTIAAEAMEEVKNFSNEITLPTKNLAKRVANQGLDFSCFAAIAIKTFLAETLTLLKVLQEDDPAKFKILLENGVKPDFARIIAILEKGDKDAVAKRNQPENC